ncbi:MAG: hypothetical protein K940chlam3_01484 [Chlamydiae bacterium]|nr:hypothetical protein [Chlamydiota bacterium]
MYIPPDKDVEIKAYSESHELKIPKELEETLNRVFRSHMEFYKLQKKNNVLKSEVVTYKIRKLLPDLRTVPIKLILACKDDRIFQCVIKFIDTCIRIRDDSKKWVAEEVDFNHSLFRELSLVHQELSRKLYQAIEKYPEEIDQLMKVLMSQAYLPPNIILMIEAARKIYPSLTVEAEASLQNALNTAERLELFKEITFCCEKIIVIKQSGVTDSEELRELYVKLKEHLMPLVLAIFREEREVFQFIQEMIIAAEKTTYVGYFCCLW